MSEFTNQSKGFIIENFILDLCRASRGEILNSCESGAWLNFKTSFQVSERPDQTSGTFPLPLSLADSESMNITWRLVESAFDKIDVQRAKNKIYFKKILSEMAKHE